MNCRTFENRAEPQRQVTVENRSEVGKEQIQQGQILEYSAEAF